MTCLLLKAVVIPASVSTLDPILALQVADDFRVRDHHLESAFSSHLAGLKNGCGTLPIDNVNLRWVLCWPI